MAFVCIEARTSGGQLVGWKYRAKLVTRKVRATPFYAPGLAAQALEAGRKRWPHLVLVAVPWTPYETATCEANQSTR